MDVANRIRRRILGVGNLRLGEGHVVVRQADRGRGMVVQVVEGQDREGAGEADFVALDILLLVRCGRLRGRLVFLRSLLC